MGFHEVSVSVWHNKILTSFSQPVRGIQAMEIPLINYMKNLWNFGGLFPRTGDGKLVEFRLWLFHGISLCQKLTETSWINNSISSP